MNAIACPPPSPSSSVLFSASRFHIYFSLSISPPDPHRPHCMSASVSTCPFLYSSTLAGLTFFSTRSHVRQCLHLSGCKEPHWNCCHISSHSKDIKEDVDNHDSAQLSQEQLLNLLYPTHVTTCQPLQTLELCGLSLPCNWKRGERIWKHLGHFRHTCVSKTVPVSPDVTVLWHFSRRRQPECHTAATLFRQPVWNCSNSHGGEKCLSKARQLTFRWQHRAIILPGHVFASYHFQGKWLKLPFAFSYIAWCSWLSTTVNIGNLTVAASFSRLLANCSCLGGKFMRFWKVIAADGFCHLCENFPRLQIHRPVLFRTSINQRSVELLLENYSCYQQSGGQSSNWSTCLKLQLSSKHFILY